jgi:hypothetical protein
VTAVGVGTAHPVAELGRRLGTALGWMRLHHGLPAAPGWLRCDELLADPRHLPGWLSDVTAAVTRAEGVPPPPVTPASYLMGWYLGVPAYAGALAFGLARRVPVLDPAAMAVHVGAVGYADGVALLADRFACLPDDPAADHPDADVVPDEAALATVLRERVAGHARAFHAAYAPDVKIGSRQRWGMLTDVLDEALWTSGTVRGDPEAGIADAALVLGEVHPPFTAATTTYRVRDLRGREHWSRRRQSCCFFYAVPSGRACFTCPRTSDAERERLACSWPDPA